MNTPSVPVSVNGSIEVCNRGLENDGTSNCIALNNFWCTLSIQVNKAGQDGCRQSANFWAASQAVSMRRVHVTGANLSLMDYCTAGPQFASGGFIADSELPVTINGSQQQWIIRNSKVTEWTNGVWNQVLSGVEGAQEARPSQPDYPERRVLARRRPAHRKDHDRARGQSRQRVQLEQPVDRHR